MGLHEFGGCWGVDKIERKMNSKQYHNILSDKMSMSIMKFEKEAEEWLFQHDNDPEHTNGLTIMQSKY